MEVQYTNTQYNICKTVQLAKDCTTIFIDVEYVIKHQEVGA